MAGRWPERIGRGLVVTGAAIMVLSACSRAWWIVRGGSELFAGRVSSIGPITGTWCTTESPWCHEEHLEFLGHGFATAGTVAFYATLATAAAAAMLVVAKRRETVRVARAAIAAAVTAAIAGVVLAVRFHPRGQSERGVGLLVLLAGAACAVAGAWLARRGEPAVVRARPRLGRVLVIAACALGVVIASSNQFWHWQWSDERDRVGLDSSERCWVDPGRTLCTHDDPPTEQFGLDLSDHSAFGTIAAQTQHVALVAAVLALLALFLFRWLRFAHVLWIVTGLLAYATFAIAPDLGLARDVKLGVGFPLLWLACLLGYAGHVLAGER